MRDFKKFTSTQIRKEIERVTPEKLDQLRISEEGRVFRAWQDRYDELYLEDRHLLETKLDYLHSNPLQERWSLVDRQESYPHSSACFYELGIQSPIPIVHYSEFV
jgi:putative transposase